MKTYTGGCHCGAVAYEVETDLKDTITCNCSHCEKKGFILNFVDAVKFRLLKGKENLETYQFNKKHIDHHFCKTCGTQSFGESSAYGKVAVNVRCLDGVDISTLSPKHVDGKGA